MPRDTATARLAAEQAIEYSETRTETYVATAECPPREAVRAEARVETHAPKHYAEAEKQADIAVNAERAQSAAHSAHQDEHPVEHLDKAVADAGILIAANIDATRHSMAARSHIRHAEAEERKAAKETEAALATARREAKKKAEAIAATDDRTVAATITSENATDERFTATAAVGARPAARGVAVVKTHADEHLAKAAVEREKAAASAAAAASASARAAAARPASEASSSVRSLRNAIAARFREARAWLKAKFSRRKARRESQKGQTELAADLDAARRRAMQAAEDEAAIRDRLAVPTSLTGIRTVTKDGLSAAHVVPIERGGRETEAVEAARSGLAGPEHMLLGVEAQAGGAGAAPRSYGSTAAVARLPAGDADGAPRSSARVEGLGTRSLAEIKAMGVDRVEGLGTRSLAEIEALAASRGGTAAPCGPARVAARDVAGQIGPVHETQEKALLGAAQADVARYGADERIPAGQRNSAVA